MSAFDALMKYSKKTSGVKKKKSKNSRPEKQVEKEVLALSKILGFDLSVIESKAVYSRAAGVYLSGQAEQGFSDLVGNDKNGHALFIELKAKGKLSTVSASQIYFLTRKIKTNAFAVVVDSSDLLARLYTQWVMIKKECSLKAQEYLLNELARK
jgi:hypothetical protein